MPTIQQLFGHTTSNVSEANFEVAFGGLLEGVLGGIDNECRVVQSAVPAMTVEVMTGTFITGGVFARVSAQAPPLVVTVAHGALPRIDRVICRRDNATDTVTVLMLDGTPNANPVPFPLTRAGGVWEISLAQVYVAAGVGNITRANIADERRSRPVCGLISPNGSPDALFPLVNNLGQIGLAEGHSAGPTLSGHGLLAAITELGTPSAGMDTDGAYLNYASGGVIGNDAGWDADWTTYGQLDSAFLAKFKLPTVITNQRVFVGLSQAGLVTMVGADSPATSYIGLQYSTPRADATWQFIARDIAQTIFDSQVPVTTDAFTVRILRDVTNDLWQIDLLDNGGNVLAGCTFDGAVDDVPAFSILQATEGLETRVGAPREFRHYYTHIVNQLT